MRTWERDDPDLTRPIAAPLDRCAQLLGTDLAAVRADVGLHVGGGLADGSKVGSLMQLECQLRPEAFGPRRPGGYLTRRRARTANTEDGG
jgi:hypothetical protein